MARDETITHIFVLTNVSKRLLEVIPLDSWVGHSDIARAQGKVRLNPHEIALLRELAERDYLDSRRIAYGTKGGTGVLQYRKRSTEPAG